MDDIHRALFEDFARHLDDWTAQAERVITEGTDRVSGFSDVKDSVQLLQSTLTPEQRDAVRALCFTSMSGLLHSVMLTLDGATALADSYTVSTVASDGDALGPGLNEMLVEHLYETNRLPYRNPTRG